MSIADKVTSITNHLIADWESIENIGGTAEDKNIENIASVINGIYDNLPKTTGEDTNLSLTTLKGKMNTTLKGDTQQTQYSGYNKINCSMDTTTISGVTATHNADGTYTINGTATANVYFDICFFELPAGTYKLVGCPSGGSWANYVQYVRRVDGQDFSLNDMGNGGTITTTGNEGQLRLSIMIYNGYTANNLVFKPMITTNTSLTYNDYEPYVGGTASPNPSYPQNIEVVTGTQEVKVENVNKLPYASESTNTINGMVFTSNGKGTYILNETASATSYYDYSISEYTIKSTDYLYLKNTETNSNISVALLNGSTQIMYTGPSQTNRVVSLSSYAGSTINTLRIRTTAQTLSNFTLKPMIAEITTLTDFVEHQEQTQVVELSSKNLLNLSVVGKVPSVTNGNLVDSTTGACSDFIEVDNAKHYMLSFSGVSYMYAFLYGADKSYITAQQYNTSGSYDISTINNFNTCKYVRIRVDNKDYVESPQLEEGSSATSFEEYYNYELCKIGNYQDYLYKSNNKWYKKEYIGKVVLNGSESWAYYQAGLVFYCNEYNDIFATGEINMDIYSNYFKGGSYGTTNNVILINNIGRIHIRYDDITSANDFKTWLSTHNTLVYARRGTPQDIEITNETLIEQLNNLEKLKSYNGVTNINCSGNLSAILSVSALKGE